MTWTDLGLSVLGLPGLLWSGYLAILAILARPITVLLSLSTRTQIVVIVPAHNEKSGLTDTVQSLQQLDYPSELVRLLVVADNCEDRTAERAVASRAQV